MNLLSETKLLKPLCIPALQLKYSSATHSMYDSSLKGSIFDSTELSKKMSELNDEIQRCKRELNNTNKAILELGYEKQVLITVIAEQKLKIKTLIKDINE